MCQQQNFLQIMLDSLVLIGSAHASCLSFRRCVAAAGSVPLECSCKLRSERGCTEGKVTLGPKVNPICVQDKIQAPAYFVNMENNGEVSVMS
jgi:hypothetical protein